MLPSLTPKMAKEPHVLEQYSTELFEETSGAVVSEDDIESSP